MTVISLISASVEPVTVLVSLLRLTWLNKGQIKTTSWMFLEDSVCLFFFFYPCVWTSVNLLSLCVSVPTEGRASCTAGKWLMRRLLLPHPGTKRPPVGAAGGFSLPSAAHGGNHQQITSSSNEARCHPFSPPLPSHHQSGGGGGGRAGGWGGEERLLVMVVKGNVERGRLSPN